MPAPRLDTVARDLRFERQHLENLAAWQPHCNHPMFTQCTWTGKHHAQHAHPGRCCWHYTACTGE